MGILSFILIGTALALKSTSDVATAGALENEMERTSQNALSQMARELSDSAPRIVTVSADGSSVQFQVPVDLDGNGTVLDRSGAIEFGIQENGSPMPGTITYRFVQNVSQGALEVIRERRTFARGGMMRVAKPAGGPEQTGRFLTNRLLVQPDGDWGGDIDGDGIADPIFRLDPTSGRVTINLWAVQPVRGRSAQVTHDTRNVCLKNR